MVLRASGYRVRIEEPAWKASGKLENDACDAQHPPRFDPRQIQRYVLQRVFKLGWTRERFGQFDRSWDVNNVGLDRAERIGEKYQWIAYYEILALIADHFQYREFPSETARDHTYQGPWQNWLRDIDPTCTIRLRRSAGWSYRDGGNFAAWWTSGRYDNWEEADKLREWVVLREDLPKIEDLLVVTNPEDGTRWLNGNSSFFWQQRPPADRDLFEIERGQLSYWFTGYLIRKDEAETFLKWAEGLSSFAPGIPEATEVYDVFMGEHAWAPAASYTQKPLYDRGSAQPASNCPVKIRPVASKYPLQTTRLDCSVLESSWLHLPVADLIIGMGLRWYGRAADFLDVNGALVAFDPIAHADGPSMLLLREELIRTFLDQRGLTIAWTVLGIKYVRLRDPAPEYPQLRTHGAYVLSKKGPDGFVKHIVVNQT